MDLPKVDKGSSQPLYLQIQKTILDAIQQRRLPPDERIPSATELSEILGVSRMTVRQGVQELVRNGKLYTVPGIGTFVTEEHKIEPNLQSLHGFTDESGKYGFSPSSQLISLRTLPATGKLASIFGVNMGTPILCLSRKRQANNHPLGIENSHMLAANFPGFERYDWSKESLYRVLREDFHVNLDHALHLVESVAADREIARLLTIPRGAPVMTVERHTFSSDNNLIEFVSSIYRADCVRFKVETVARNPMAIIPPVDSIPQPPPAGKEEK